MCQLKQLTMKMTMIGWFEMTRTTRVSAALLALCLVIAPLAGCAPEPGAPGSGVGGAGDSSGPKTPGSPGSSPDEKTEPEGGSWPAENPDEVFEKQQDLPEDFPEGFVIPERAAIDNTGSRGYGTWYVVLSAADQTAATSIWEEVIAAGGFTVSDEVSTPEGGVAATLSSGDLGVTGMTVPSSDGTVLITYDITSVMP